MSEKIHRISRKDFLKLAGLGLGTWMVDAIFGSDQIDFYSLFDEKLPPVKIILPYRGNTLKLVDYFLGGKLSALVTNPQTIVYRVWDLTEKDETNLKDLLGDYSCEEFRDFYLYTFPIKEGEGLNNSFRLLISKESKGSRLKIVQAFKKNDNKSITIARLPHQILSEIPEICAGISIGATNPYFISYAEEGINVFGFEENDYTFPFAPYVLLNFVGNLQNPRDALLLEKVSRRSPLGEYHHRNLVNIGQGILYQPQYIISKEEDGQIIFRGSQTFEHRWDQTVNLFGWVGKNIVFLSGPWWFNQPDNNWVGGLVEEMFSRIGLKENFLLASADTGGQTGFWYRNNNRLCFSHEDQAHQHTTAMMLGLASN